MKRGWVFGALVKQNPLGNPAVIIGLIITLAAVSAVILGLSSGFAQKCSPGSVYDPVNRLCHKKCPPELPEYDPLWLQENGCHKRCPEGHHFDRNTGECITCGKGFEFDSYSSQCLLKCTSDTQCPLGTCTEGKCCKAVCSDGGCCPSGTCAPHPEDPSKTICCAPKAICKNKDGRAFCCGGGTVCSKGQCVAACGAKGKEFTCNPKETCILLGNVSGPTLNRLKKEKGKIQLDGTDAYMCVNQEDKCQFGHEYAVPAPINNRYPCFQIDKLSEQFGLGFCGGAVAGRTDSASYCLQHSKNKFTCEAQANTSEGFKHNCKWFDIVKGMSGGPKKVDELRRAVEDANINQGFWCDPSDKTSAFSRTFGRVVLNPGQCSFKDCLASTAQPGVSNIFYDNNVCIALQDCNTEKNPGLTNKTIKGIGLGTANISVEDTKTVPVKLDKRKKAANIDWTSEFPSCPKNLEGLDERQKTSLGHLCSAYLDAGKVCIPGEDEGAVRTSSQQCFGRGTYNPKTKRCNCNCYNPKLSTNCAHKDKWSGKRCAYNRFTTCNQRSDEAPNDEGVCTSCKARVNSALGVTDRFGGDHCQYNRADCNDYGTPKPGFKKLVCECDPGWTSIPGQPYCNQPSTNWKSLERNSDKYGGPGSGYGGPPYRAWASLGTLGCAPGKGSGTQCNNQPGVCECRVVNNLGAQIALALSGVFTFGATTAVAVTMKAVEETSGSSSKGADKHCASCTEMACCPKIREKKIENFGEEQTGKESPGKEQDGKKAPPPKKKPLTGELIKSRPCPNCPDITCFDWSKVKKRPVSLEGPSTPVEWDQYECGDCRKSDASGPDEKPACGGMVICPASPNVYFEQIGGNKNNDGPKHGKLKFCNDENPKKIWKISVLTIIPLW